MKILLVNSDWEPVAEDYDGRKFHVVFDLHSWFDYDEIERLLEWLGTNNIEYHIFGDDLVFYKPKEATLFVLTWIK